MPCVAHGEGLLCATHDKLCRQAVLPPSPDVRHIFFCRVSSLTHGKASLCAHNLAVSKGKVHRRRVCRLFIAVSNTWQNLRRVLFRLCRVRQAHGESPNPVVSGSSKNPT